MLPTKRFMANKPHRFYVYEFEEYHFVLFYLWATAASADLFHSAIGERRSVLGPRRSLVVVYRRLELGDQRSSHVARHSSLVARRSSSRNLKSRYADLTYFTLLYFTFFTYLHTYPKQKRILRGSACPRDKGDEQPLTADGGMELGRRRSSLVARCFVARCSLFRRSSLVARDREIPLHTYTNQNEFWSEVHALETRETSNR